MRDDKRKQARDFGDAYRAGYRAAIEDAARACERGVIGGPTTAIEIARHNIACAQCAAAVRALGE